jgi:hypothetical protein
MTDLLDIRIGWPPFEMKKMGLPATLHARQLLAFPPRNFSTSLSVAE